LLVLICDPVRGEELLLADFSSTFSLSQSLQPSSCPTSRIRSPMIRISSTWRWTARRCWRRRHRMIPRRPAGFRTTNSATFGQTFSRPKEMTSSFSPKPARWVFRSCYTVSQKTSHLRQLYFAYTVIYKIWQV